jgi:WD40 repeat protein
MKRRKIAPMQHRLRARTCPIAYLAAWCVFVVSIGCRFEQSTAPNPPDGNKKQVATAPASVAATEPVVARLPRYTIPPLGELKLHRGVTNDPSFSADGRLLATAASLLDRRIAIWRMPEGTLLSAFEIPGAQGISEVCFSEDSDLLAYGTSGRTYGVIQVSNGKPLVQHEDSRFHYHHGLHWTENNEFVYAVANYGGDNELHRLSLQTGESQVVFPKTSTADIRFGACTHMPLMISAWGGQNARTDLFALGKTIDRSDPQTFFLLPSTPSIPYRFVISHDGTHVAFSEDSADRKVDVIEIASSKRIGGFEGTDDQLGKFQFLPGSNTKLIASSIRHTWRYNAIAIHDITLPADQVPKLEVHAPTTVTGISLSRDGKLLALGFYDGEAAVWDLAEIEKGPSQ